MLETTAVTQSWAIMAVVIVWSCLLPPWLSLLCIVSALFLAFLVQSCFLQHSWFHPLTFWVSFTYIVRSVTCVATCGVAGATYKVDCAKPLQDVTHFKSLLAASRKKPKQIPKMTKKNGLVSALLPIRLTLQSCAKGIEIVPLFYCQSDACKKVFLCLHLGNLALSILCGTACFCRETLSKR